MNKRLYVALNVDCTLPGLLHLRHMSYIQIFFHDNLNINYLNINLRFKKEEKKIIHTLDVFL